MPTLTPQSRSEEATDAAFQDGLYAATCGIIPSSLALWAAMKNPSFVKATNWQSRTALVAMPALFLYAYVGEEKLREKMNDIASDTQNNKLQNNNTQQTLKTGSTKIEWTGGNNSLHERKWRDYVLKSSFTMSSAPEDGDDAETQLLKLHLKSVEDSGFRIVPGEKLKIHHKISNFWQENPFKILGTAGLPAVAYIFYSRNQQQHLQLQSKLMHTRVYGQFMVISALLGLMGYKEYMDRNGTFITELEAKNRVQQINDMKLNLLRKIDQDKRSLEEMRDKMRLDEEGKSATVLLSTSSTEIDRKTAESLVVDNGAPDKGEENQIKKKEQNDVDVATVVV